MKNLPQKKTPGPDSFDGENTSYTNVFQKREERTLFTSSYEAKCYGLNCVPQKINMLKSQPSLPQNITIFGNKILTEVIKLK